MKHIETCNFLFWWAVFWCVNSSAQVSDHFSPLMIPSRFVVPDQQVPLDSLDIRVSGKYWIVYSDRNDNLTYFDSLMTEKKSTTEFMEPFFVIEEKPGKLHIVKDPDFQSERFIKLAEDYGWIEKNRLLLWQHCLVSHENKNYIKALIQNTMNVVLQERTELGTVYYFNPSLKSQTKKLSRTYEILYVYKMLDKRMLLGKSPMIHAESSKADILGWVDENKITWWDRNLAVEVNWEKNAIEERKEKNLPVCFFSVPDKIHALKYGKGEKITIKLTIWDQDNFGERNPGDIFRFPVLNIDSTYNLLNAYVFTSNVAGQVLQTVMPQKNRFLPGIAPLTIKGLDTPPFIFNLLLSRMDLARLVIFGEELSGTYSDENVRTGIKKVIRRHFMEKFEKSDFNLNIDTLTISHISSFLFDFPANGNLKNARLSQMEDPSIIPDDQISTFLTDIAGKVQELKQIMNAKDYPYGFQSFDIYYYWINTKLLLL